MSKKFVRKRDPNTIKAKREHANLAFIEATEAPDSSSISSTIIESDLFMENWLEEFTTLRDNVRSFITESLDKYIALIQELEKLKSQLPANESELKTALDNYESFLTHLMPSGPENTATEEDALSVSPTPRPGG